MGRRKQTSRNWCWKCSGPEERKKLGPPTCEADAFIRSMVCSGCSTGSGSGIRAIARIQGDKVLSVRYEAVGYPGRSRHG